MRLAASSRLVIAALLCVASVSADAGTRLVHGIGRAAIAGRDVAGARKAALAEALYDAAGQVRMVVRGSSYLSNSGAIQEESGVAVSGQLKGYEVVDEHREGDHFVVAIDALAETDDGACGDTKKSDLIIGAMEVRVAPGLSGAIERRARESIEDLIALLKGSESFQITDGRAQNPVARTGASVRQNLSYLARLNGYSPNPGGYLLSASLKVGRSRSDNWMIEETAADLSATIRLTDTATGAVIETFEEHGRLTLDRHLAYVDLPVPGAKNHDFNALWQSVVNRIGERIGCDSLRAVVTSVSGARATLSVGSANGVKAGDYFLVEMPGGTRNGWQLIRVEETAATSSMARLMKPKPSILPNTVAVLLQ